MIRIEQPPRDPSAFQRCRRTCAWAIAIALGPVSGLSAQAPPEGRSDENPLADPSAPEFATPAQLHPDSRSIRPHGTGMGMGPGNMGGGPGYSATWYPTRSLSSEPGSLGLIRQSASAMAPLWTDGPNRLMLSVGIGNTRFETDAKLPSSGREFPIDLWNINLGLNYMRQFDNGWSAGGMFGFGSASDKPFHSIREINLSFMGFLNVPAANDRDAWRFSLLYSPVGLLSFPIPGIAYQWNPSDRVSVGLGIPFSVMWRPTDDWTLNLSYMPISTVNARASYRLFEGCQLYAAFEWLNEGYNLVGRENAQDRFVGLEKRLVGGVTFAASERLNIDLNAGYAFDREYGTSGGGIQGTNPRDAVRVQSGAFLGGSLRLKF